MNLAKAKEYYELGILTEFTATPCSDDNETAWMLCIQGTNAKGEEQGWTLETALGHPKIYSKLESLSADVHRIMGATARQPWTMKL